jgi:hypothetical protein
LTAQAKVPEATLTFANREIVVLRNTVQGATPEIRSQRISERLRQLDDRDLAKPLTRSEVVLDQQKGIIFFIGDRQIFVLCRGRSGLRKQSSALMPLQIRSKCA